jgi:hypothetical protein
MRLFTGINLERIINFEKITLNRNIFQKIILKMFLKVSLIFVLISLIYASEVIILKSSLTDSQNEVIKRIVNKATYDGKYRDQVCDILLTYFNSVESGRWQCLIGLFFSLHLNDASYAWFSNNEPKDEWFLFRTA